MCILLIYCGFPSEPKVLIFSPLIFSCTDTHRQLKALSYFVLLQERLESITSRSVCLLAFITIVLPLSVSLVVCCHVRHTVKELYGLCCLR